jgi:YHS domain-containing protein
MRAGERLDRRFLFNPRKEKVMTRRISKLFLISAAAFLFLSGVGFAHDPKKKSGEMMQGCEEHHAAAMKATDELSMHLAEAKRSSTLDQMRVHVEAADKALADMKTHMSQCMEMMDKMHGGTAGATMGSGTAAGEKKAAGKVIDPVCGMEVNSATAPSATYAGKTYYFCSEEDKAKFEKNPEQYLKKG